MLSNSIKINRRFTSFTSSPINFFNFANITNTSNPGQFMNGSRINLVSVCRVFFGLNNSRNLDFPNVSLLLNFTRTRSQHRTAFLDLFRPRIRNFINFTGMLATFTITRSRMTRPRFPRRVTKGFPNMNSIVNPIGVLDASLGSNSIRTLKRNTRNNRKHARRGTTVLENFIGLPWGLLRGVRNFHLNFMRFPITDGGGFSRNISKLGNLSVGSRRYVLLEGRPRVGSLGIR